MEMYDMRVGLSHVRRGLNCATYAISCPQGHKAAAVAADRHKQRCHAAN
jgi:hypothetical protein